MEFLNSIGMAWGEGTGAETDLAGLETEWQNEACEAENLHIVEEYLSSLSEDLSPVDRDDQNIIKACLRNVVWYASLQREHSN